MRNRILVAAVFALASMPAMAQRSRSTTGTVINSGPSIYLGDCLLSNSGAPCTTAALPPPCDDGYQAVYKIKTPNIIIPMCARDLKPPKGTR